jgi:hypothetical protein
MAYKLYRAKVSVEFVIASEDSLDAKHDKYDIHEWCRQHIGDSGFNLSDIHLSYIMEEAHLPPGWDLNCIPYGEDVNEMTIRQLMSGQTPKFNVHDIIERVGDALSEKERKTLNEWVAKAEDAINGR